MVFKRRFPYPYKDFIKQLLPDPTDLPHGLYDIFCEHSFYNESLLMEKMPVDIARIGIVREPFSRLQSEFAYRNIYKIIGLEAHPRSIALFLLKPQYYIDRSKFKSRIHVLTHNLVAREFGYTNKLNLDQYLKSIEAKFIVLVFDMLDESLVVLKRKLCWSLKDVLYLPMRKRSYNRHVNESLIDLYKAWSPHDFAFYDHFKQVMVREIASQGHNFHREVKWFQYLANKTTAFCQSTCEMLVNGVKNGRDRVYMRHCLSQNLSFEGNEWDDERFTVSGYECIMMMFDPDVYRYSQRVKQWPEVCHGQQLPDTDMDKVRSYCGDHFAYTFPWEVLYNYTDTFLFNCY